MSVRKYQIIVPTMGGREKYLAATLETCLAQNYPNMEVLVSNNCGGAEVKSVVDGFADSRLRYVETERFMSMSEHWDFALVRSVGDVVCFIGDDDAMMPDALSTVENIFAEHEDIECVTHHPGQYYWPDFPENSLKNMFSFNPGTRTLELIDTKPVFKAVAEFREWYGRLPFLYHGFVKRRVLQRILDSHALLFRMASPDIYSDLALALSMKRYARFDGCLTMGGQGAKSVGATFARSNETAKAFLRQLPEYLVPRYYAGSIQFQVLEGVERTIESFGFTGHLDFSWIRFVKQTISEAMLSPLHCEKILISLEEIAGKKFPWNGKLFTLPLLWVLRSKLMREAGQALMRRRQRSGISGWKNAAEVWKVDNIHDLVKALAKQ